jgi:LysR family tcuABC transcriptional regulator
MELRQLRYFVRVVELGSMGRASAELGVTTSTLSQQISTLEGGLSTRLLQRRSTGVVPTAAGLDFYRQAQLILRQVEDATRIAQHGRLTGHVSVGMAPTTAARLALPFMRAMAERYADIRLHMVEGLSGHVSALLNSRQIDLAVVFDTQAARRWSVMPLLEESLFVIAPPAHLATLPQRAGRMRLQALAGVPLVLPSTGAGSLRSLVDAALARAAVQPRVVGEIDGLDTLLAAVRAGMGVTLHTASALALLRDDTLGALEVADPQLRRQSLLASLSDDELSPAGLAARVVLAETARGLLDRGEWRGARVVTA